MLEAVIGGFWLDFNAPLTTQHRSICVQVSIVALGEADKSAPDREMGIGFILDLPACLLTEVTVICLKKETRQSLLKLS